MTLLTTDASKQVGGFAYIDSTDVLGSIGAAVANMYSSYVYTSVVMRWLPQVAPGVADAGASIYIGYSDNAEHMVNTASASVATIVAAAKTMKNAKFFNAWEQFTYNVPLTRRRKMFDVNNTPSAPRTVDEDDRCVQGIILYGGDGLTASTALGRWVADVVIELRELSNLTT